MSARHGPPSARPAVRPKAARRGAAGFTLIEVIVAMAVLAVGFTALLGLHVRSLQLAARERTYTQSLLLARTLLTDTELEPLPAPGIATGDFESRFPGRYPGFVWQRTVNPTPLPDTNEVVVRVQPVDDPVAGAELTLYLRGDQG